MMILEDYPNGCARTGACYICGSSKRPGGQTADGRPDRIIDLGRDIEWEGRLCICSTCLGHAALEIGYRLPDDEELGVKNRRLGRRCQVLEERVEHYRAIINELTAAEAARNDDSDLDPSARS
jgi:hypothetical protein